MRIVDRATFLAMPAGTVFAKYEPCNFSELGIKEDTCSGDFVVQPMDHFYFEGHLDSLESERLMDRIQETGEESPPLCFDFCGRDGMFDREQLFAVFSRDDVIAMVTRLTDTLLVEGQNGFKLVPY